ncbi:hypothetical protein Zm00014a_024692 [Zea mays]|uniref:GIR1-like zinc ribbon domain-containing protein n=2 Tax=Zea mays TaxID=4577 RepID=B6TVD3_MAIZE|nr:hypothetical protein [Zea mays]PWZ46013.1 hypothetical protein Zm00014a_024692 [Zea mays]|eukprot:NP_001144509.1 uncharacterized protein LOC100277500 [Zea mays]
MSRGSSNGGVRSAARLEELQLDLSPPPVGMEVDGAGGVHGDSDSSSSSPPSSCVSSDGRSSSGGGGSSPGGSKSPMVIGACTRCLMYCMVAKKDYPTCVNCKQPCLVDLLHGEAGRVGGGARQAAAAADDDDDDKKKQVHRRERR